ncbi:MAG: sensor histidine kinase [Deltaproteobacteria bacterium]|nr:MAG: sensor histidine kinase [Deltaproteobacteria bacterium]
MHNGTPDRSFSLRIAVIVGLLAGITALHYLTTLQHQHAHDIYRRLYYVPIVLGGLWFTLRGGLGAAIAASLLFLPHVVLQWGHHPVSQPEQYLEILLYNIIGGLTGFLSGRELEQKRAHQHAALRLEESYRTLSAQADQILEIEEQLRRADRLSTLGELSAGLAHEIRNPLGSIRGTAEILKDGVAADDPRHEFAEILIKEVDRLNRVLEDFLRFARQAPVERGIFDLNAVVREVLDLTRRQAERNDVAVVADFAELPGLPGDGGQIRQALLNLVLNALQAMPAGGQLTVTTRGGTETVEVAVADTGPGIPDGEEERIFKTFVTTRADGTGLGLPISQRIVASHGGQIRVAGTAGGGATFIVALPLQKETSP